MKFYILGSILVGVFLFSIFSASIIYYRRFLKYKKIKPIALLSLRFISLFALLILFIEPFLLYIRSQVLDREINLFIDNSKSISESISVDIIKSHADEIEEWGNKREYKTNFYLFGDTLRLSRDLTLNDSSTRYDQIANKINLTPNHLNLILTDGNPTHGFRLSDFEINNPLNIIGIGQQAYSDISIDKVDCPILAAAGDSINLSIHLHSNIDSTLTPTLKLMSDNLMLYSKEIDLPAGNNRYKYDITLSVPTEYSGVLNLDAIISDSSINQNNLNNIFKTQVIIRDISKEALLITGSLNPNTQAINKILMNIPDLSLIHLYEVGNKWNRSLDDIDLDAFKVFIYDNFPLTNTDLDIYNKIESKRAKDSKIIYFEGPSYDFNTMNMIMPNNKKFTKDNSQRKKIISDTKSLDNLIPVRKNLKTINENFDEIYLAYSDSSVAIAQKENSLYVFIPELRKVFINDPYNFFQEYLSKTLFLFIDFGEQILLSSSQREILEGEYLFLDINYPDIYDNFRIEIIIEDKVSKKQRIIPYNKIKKDISGRKYIDNLDQGLYQVYANLSSDKNLYKSNVVDIQVIENSLETSILHRNENDMKVAGLKSGGNYFSIEDYKALQSLMRSKVTTKRTNIELNIHSFHKFWFILLITLIIEWFLRKRKGLL